MTTQVHNKGEEFERKVLCGEVSLPANADILLYHDGDLSGNTTDGDDLSAGDDIGSITTEPDGSSYSRMTISLDGSTSWSLFQDSNNDYVMETNDSNLTTYVSDSSNPSTIDAYGIVVNWDDGNGAADHLWWTDTLSDVYDVQNTGQVSFENGSLAASGQNAP